MSNILRTVFIIFLTTPLFGQVEFAPIGASWVFNIPTNPHDDIDYDPLADYFELTSEEDVEISGKTYRKVGDYFFYQDGFEVYYLWEGEDRLVYNYDLEVGESVTFQLLNCENEITDVELTLESIEIVDIDGESLRRFKFEYSHMMQYDYVYTEKYGSEITILGNYADCFTITGADFEWLRCFKDEDINIKTDKFINLDGNDCYYSKPSSINEYKNLNISFFPNPASDFLQISGGSDMPVVFNLELLSVKGKVLFSEKNFNLGQSLDLAGFNSGMYIIRLNDLNGVQITAEKINIVK